jgi:non-lysosomal glucosylceramidase
MTRPEEIPGCAWMRRFDERVARQGRPMGATLSLLIEMLPTIFRLLKHMRRERKRGREVIFDPTRSLKASPEMGVPLGGLGGGTITRGWRGGFVRWQLRPGVYRYGAVAADQFSLWVRRAGEPARALVLSTRPEGVPPRERARGRSGGRGRKGSLERALSGWNWGLDNRLVTYHALYPRAWTVYAEPVPELRLTCRQISPVIPHDYRESATPAGVFVWTIENTGPTEVEAALMFTFQNGTGDENDTAGGHWNEAVPTGEAAGAGGGPVAAEEAAVDPVAGVLLHHVHRQPRPLRPGERLRDQGRYEDPLTFAIAVQGGPGIDLSRRTRFSGGEALELWEDFVVDGTLEEGIGRAGAGPTGCDQTGGSPGAAASLPGETIGAAVAAKVKVPPGESRDLIFALAWDMPLARFGSGTAWYRRYTRFYGRDGRAAEAIIRDAIRNHPSWEERIVAWQKPVLDDPDLPDWYKSALFNETYYIADGGTVWTDGMAPPGEGDETEYGHFAYLEGHEYAMYNTYDVHFYASFAMAALWPELELSLQRDYARSVRVEHPEEVSLLFSGDKAPRKVRGAVPHDLGTPFEDPWRRVNSYNAQDVSRWKDLGPKFVLQVYRDFVLTRDKGFLSEVWEAVEEAVDFVERFDRDGDGLIENDGFPDQTYDVWSAEGPSAYSGGLWVACLAAAGAMAGELRLAERAAHYDGRLAKARKAYEEKLWNGRSYDYDASGSRHHDSVMADQLAGHWYARACGLQPIVPPEHARSALSRVFELNVMGNEGGRRGAVNGMRPDGRMDRNCLQSKETWTGTTYGLAAAMLQEGLTEEAFITARGIYHTVWRDFGLWFQTPEAVDANGIYRSVGYMRPLAVWAMQWAWERTRGRRGVLAERVSPGTSPLEKRAVPARARFSPSPGN